MKHPTATGIITRVVSSLRIFKTMGVFLFFVLLPFVFHPATFAKYDPMYVTNNIYGVHLADTNDIDEASKLVNSAGGDWGYVTIVIHDTDRNTAKWQEIFNRLRRLHLIPLVRLASHPEGDSWAVPDVNGIRDWADFLGSLNWPTENRYVILYNEPNHSREWGYKIDPEGYASVFVELSKKLKDKSQDFFILPAGMDASASSDGEALAAPDYIKRMFAAKPEMRDLMDGWTSHSYANPAFSGTPYAEGRGTIRSFAWEREYIKSLGVTKKLPIFITETGWQHSGGRFNDLRLLSPETVGNYLTIMSQTAWKDQDIVAVTPFVFNYQDLPFDHFSFRKMGTSEYYAHYFSYQSIPKTKGVPHQRESYAFKTPLIPDRLIADSSYVLEAELKNTGQAIIDPSDGYSIEALGFPPGFKLLPGPLVTIAPGESQTITLSLKTPKEAGTYTVKTVIAHGDTKTVAEQKSVTVIPPPSITVDAPLGWRTVSDASDVTVLFYDTQDKLIHKETGKSLKNGSVTVPSVHHMIPGRKYRAVILVPYYLPRQTIMVMGTTDVQVTMQRLLPLDFDRDGKLTLKDLIAGAFLKPAFVMPLFF